MSEMLGFCISCGEYKLINRNYLCLVCQSAFNAECNKNISDDMKKAIADFTNWKIEVEKEVRFSIVTVNDKTRLT